MCFISDMFSFTLGHSGGLNQEAVVHLDEVKHIDRCHQLLLKPCNQMRSRRESILSKRRRALETHRLNQIEET